VTWSFDEALPTEKDLIRALIGDVNSSSPLVSDELIASYLSGGLLAQATLRLAAADIAIVISGLFINRANSMSEGGASVNWGDRAKAFRDLAASLREADVSVDADGLFDWAEQISPGDDFAQRERFRDQIFRNAV
jgi:hypothetical protein